MEYHKLVRDNIPKIIESKGDKAVVRIATESEYEAALVKKVTEEAAEFAEKPSVEEMADILEVLYAYAKFKNIPLSDLEKVRLQKREVRGGFDKWIILESSE